MYNFNTISKLIELVEENNISIVELIIQREMEINEKSEEDILGLMRKNLEVMKDAVEKGLTENLKSTSGLVGGDAKLVDKARTQGKTITGEVMSSAIANALAISEVNACMGKIVAVPTAGSCGILPGAVLAVVKDRKIDDEKVVQAMFVAAAIGIVIAEQASVSGAEGGCQAECGSASAMAAAAIVYMLGGSNKQICNAVALSLKSILGLVCDPVAGLVEVPCVKRNAMGAGNALISAEMALAGVESVIPVDEVISAMKEVGDSIPKELKETSVGGLAVTPTGCKIKDKLLNCKL